LQAGLEKKSTWNVVDAAEFKVPLIETVPPAIAAPVMTG
jgi:hypothetical protein